MLFYSAQTVKLPPPRPIWHQCLPVHLSGILVRAQALVNTFGTCREPLLTTCQLPFANLCLVMSTTNSTSKAQNKLRLNYVPSCVQHITADAVTARVLPLLYAHVCHETVRDAHFVLDCTRAPRWRATFFHESNASARRTSRPKRRHERRRV